MRIVPLKATHLPGILRIEQESQSAPWSERSFANEIINPSSLFRVGEEGGQVVAYGGLWLLVDEAHVTTLCVAPDQRRRGLGRALIVHLLNEAREAGMACATLEVRESNVAAISLYERLGFVRAAIRKQYYPDNRENAVVMWLYSFAEWPS